MVLSTGRGAVCGPLLGRLHCVGAPGTTECAQSLERVRAVSSELGVPLAEDKCEGPTTRLVFLGFEIDSSEGVLRLPQEKVERLQELLLGWLERRWCWRRDLESLIGKLQDAAKVIPPGQGVFAAYDRSAAGRMAILSPHTVEQGILCRFTVVAVPPVSLEWSEVYPVAEAGRSSGFRRIWVMGVWAILWY